MSFPRILSTLIAVLAATALVACGGDSGSSGSSGGSSGSSGSSGGSSGSAGSSGGSSGESSSGSDQKYPTIEKVETDSSGDGTVFNVTISSPYDSPDRYADGWRVLDPDGKELGTTQLAHDHASEQPFTRSSEPVKIPDGVDTVTVEGHDTDNGYGGETKEVPVG